MRALLYGMCDLGPREWVQFRNLGDECLRDVAEGIIAGMGVTCYYGGPDAGVWDLDRASDFAARGDLLVFAGGGQLLPWATESGWAWRGPHDVAPIAGRRTVFLSVGLNEGAPTEDMSDSIFALGANGAAGSGRDSMTVEWLTRSGLPANTVPDLAFATAVPEASGRSGVLLAAWPDMPDGLPEALSDITGECVSLTAHTEADAERYGVRFPESPAVLLQQYASAEFVVGARYHSAVLAVATKTPFAWVWPHFDPRATALLSDHKHLNDRICFWRTSGSDEFELAEMVARVRGVPCRWLNEWSGAMRDRVAIGTRGICSEALQ